MAEEIDRLQQRNWGTPEGIDKSKTEIVAHHIECGDPSRGTKMYIVE